MEVQLQDIIDKIKADGVQTAETQAAEIIRDAESKAAEILDKARAEAASIVADGTAEAQRFEKASIASIEQAGRNTLLAFKVGVTDALTQLIQTKTAECYDASVLKALIPETVKLCAKNSGEDDLAVLLPPADADKLQANLVAALKDALKNGIEIKADDSIVCGFKVAMKDGSAYYDFSAPEVANLFARYLNPKVAEILSGAAGSIQ